MCTYDSIVLCMIKCRAYESAGGLHTFGSMQNGEKASELSGNALPWTASGRSMRTRYEFFTCDSGVVGGRHLQLSPKNHTFFYHSTPFYAIPGHFRPF